MNFRFDEEAHPEVCVHFPLIQSTSTITENGLIKDYDFISVVGGREYLRTKNIKMVNTEKRDVALNSIVAALCNKGSNVIVASDTVIDIDCSKKLSKKSAKLFHFVNLDKVCAHVKC